MTADRDNTIRSLTVNSKDASLAGEYTITVTAISENGIAYDADNTATFKLTLEAAPEPAPDTSGSGSGTGTKPGPDVKVIKIVETI